MSNLSEDIIRETLLGVANTLGVRIDIPDETIADLAATLQTEIDRIEAVETESFEFLNELALAFRAAENHPRPQYAPVLEGVRAVLAHLTAAGRLIPADDEMRLTAEQVEDVRIVLGLNGSQDIKVVLDAQARLRALFPATEPAEEVKPVKFRKMTPKYATANFGFPDVTVDPFTPFTRWAYKDSDGDKWAWNGDQWELHVVLPDDTEPPAEPAEDCWGDVNPNDPQGRTYREKYPHLASSPVVPAPTETEAGHA